MDVVALRELVLEALDRTERATHMAAVAGCDERHREALVLVQQLDGCAQKLEVWAGERVRRDARVTINTSKPRTEEEIRADALRPDGLGMVRDPDKLLAALDEHSRELWEEAQPLAEQALNAARESWGVLPVPTRPITVVDEDEFACPECEDSQECEECEGEGEMDGEECGGCSGSGVCQSCE